MPDPLLYLKSMSVAAIVSAVFVLALAWLRRSADSTWFNSTCVSAMGLGLAFGCDVLVVRWAWPPVQGLDRFLLIVMPTALGIELVAGLERIPRWGASCLRLSLAAAIPRILLHGSVHLTGTGNDWTWWDAGAVLVVCSVLLAVTWGLLFWLSLRSGGISIPLALGMTTQCAGLTVMLAGYLKGGSTAFPLAATIVSTVVAARLIAMRSGMPQKYGSPSIVGIGVVSLFGVLMIGRFFGRLSTWSALALLLIPLLCWTTETPFLRHRKPWVVGSLRLVLVAIPLLLILAVAKRDFDRNMAPLQGDMPGATK